MKYKKYLGQHFLHDTAKIYRMINEMELTKKDLILEIGAGSGILTKKLLEKAAKVIAVEIDKEAFEKLKEKTKSFDNLILINDDFLKLNISEIYNAEIKNLKGKFILAGNIPYYITGSIIEKIISEREIINFAFLTLQKEVAERITAKEGSKTYGALSIFVQFYADVSLLFKISKKAFFPEPKVDSAFIKLDFNKEPLKVKNESLFFKIVKSAFSSRRKMLINNLEKSFNISKEELKSILKKANIPENKRAEDISLLDFINLFDIIYENLNELR